MIFITTVFLILSLLIQTITSNYLGYTYQSLSPFITLYLLIALLMIKPYFENDKKYLLTLLIAGFLSGITYTNAVFLNISLFFVAYCFTKFFHFYFPYNYLTINISTLIGIFLYHILSFLFLITIGYDKYPFHMLLQILLDSIPMTILYTTVSYFLLETIFHHFNLRKIK